MNLLRRVLPAPLSSVALFVAWLLLARAPGAGNVALGVLLALGVPHLFPALRMQGTRVRRPGEFSSYSNYGASLAGYIVQCVSGVPYDDYIATNILQPLGMAHTTSRQPLPLKPSVSTWVSPVGEIVISIVLVVMVRRHLRRGS